jgi:hypothetical protein
MPLSSIELFVDGGFGRSVGEVNRSLWHGAGELDRGDVQGSGPNGDHDARG